MGPVAAMFLVESHLQSLEALEIFEVALDKDLGQESLNT